MADARSVAFMVPGSIDTRTGGSIYDRRMAEGLRERGWLVELVELDASFPDPTGRALERAAESFESVRDGALVIVDGLALSAMPEQVERAAMRLTVVALVHLPLAAGIGNDAGASGALETGERRALAATSKIVVTGTAALGMLARYDLPSGRVVVVEPGTDRQPVACGSGSSPLRLLSVATLNPGKGHDVLLRALGQIAGLEWRLICAGSLTRHPPTVAAVRSAARALGLEDRVDLAGELDDARLSACYDASDVFVLATLQETYGMAVAEALARGLPVVSTDTGAIRALVGDWAGIVVPPGDAGALASALRRVLTDSALRTHLAEGARRVREQLRSWDDAAEQLSAVLARLDRHD